MIKRLIYLSIPAAQLDSSDLQSILTQSRINNLKAGLTGYLAYSRDHFFQVLEGEPESVDHCFTTILRDSRHHGVEMLSQGIYHRRIFGTWSMSFKVLDSETFEETKIAIIKASESADDSINYSELGLLAKQKLYQLPQKNDINDWAQNELKQRHIILMSLDAELRRKVENIFSHSRLDIIGLSSAVYEQVFDNEIDMLLLDDSHNAEAVFEICSNLKQNKRTRDIPILILSEEMLSLAEEYAFDLGADDFIAKTSGQNALSARLRNHLRSKDIKQQLHKANQIFSWEREEIEKTLDHLRREFSPEQTEGFHYYLTPLEKASGDIVMHRKVKKGVDWYLLGDFTGHGIVAAIDTPIVANIFNGESDLAPEEMLSRINIAIKNQVPVGRFLAAVLVAKDIEKNRLDIWNLGMPEQLFQDGELHLVASTFLPLGIDASENYSKPSATYEISDNSVLLCYTDGLSDSVNKYTKNSSLRNIVQPWLSMPSPSRPELKELMDFILSILGEAIHDDITIMTLEPCSE